MSCTVSVYNVTSVYGGRTLLRDVPHRDARSLLNAVWYVAVLKY